MSMRGRSRSTAVDRAGRADQHDDSGLLGQIELHLTARAANRIEADEALEPAVRELQDALGPAVYSTDGRPLEVVLATCCASAS